MGRSREAASQPAIDAKAGAVVLYCAHWPITTGMAGMMPMPGKIDGAHRNTGSYWARAMPSIKDLFGHFQYI